MDYIHDCDQVYYLLDGTLTLLVGDMEYAAGPESLVFVPRGTPHRSVNAGLTPEVHLDILLPPPPRGVPVYRPPGPGQEAPGEPVVCQAGRARPGAEPGEPSVTPLASPRTGTPGIWRSSCPHLTGGRSAGPSPSA